MPASETSLPAVDISIIVPVFNVAEFVASCLDSIRLQSFDREFEVILIDDCSTDESGEICRRYCQQNPGFVFLQNPENRGVSAARNRGLDTARGRYFMFVDPDDLLPLDALALLHQAAESTSSDIVKGNNTIFDSSSEKAARYDVPRPRQVRGDRVLTTLFEHRFVRGHPWGKLFRRDRLGEFRFPPGIRMAQDLFYCSEVFARADSLYLLDRNVYRYRNRETGSTGRKFKSGSYLDWLGSVENIGVFAKTSEQRRAHRNLLLRTMTQLARECRQLESDDAEKVLSTVMRHCRRWQIDLASILREHGLDLRALARFLKLRRAISQTRRHLPASNSGRHPR